MTLRRVAGVDGCPGGWIAVLVDEDLGSSPRIEIVSSIEAILDRPDSPAILAVDMPIGLSDRLDGPGRACEVAVRKLLGPRQSSVFSIPARVAVTESTDYADACTIAAANSEPSRRVSRQAFHIFPKIRQIDALLRSRPDLRSRVFETHPEVCFMHLNGGQPLATAKKNRGRINPLGLGERRWLLVAAGFPADFMEAGRKPPRPAAGDDFLDACAAAWTALRILRGEAACYPDPPPRDAFGLEMAIRA